MSSQGTEVCAAGTIACWSCLFCKKTLFSCCDNPNPNAEMEGDGPLPLRAVRLSHMLGGFPGG